ncbi:MAG: TIGR02186 family protein [Maricaulis sp.]|uniref:TIGR02186 family protein n=1 Tax=Maricaulis sp. TaxID=1486257 RepID=UPI00261B673A|nr:TIGR02186 family protein [Maricaulis sp.]MDM7984501.1 TIGR02186 family protein [Maricaulis sp.]
MIIALLASLLTQQAVPQEAPQIMAALTHETVEIREDFAGTELILYGATRGLTIQDEIVVVLRGPDQDLRVMQKQRSFGIWVNAQAQEFDAVPAYYSIASSRPIEEIASRDALVRNRIGLAQLLDESATQATMDLEPYFAAVERAGARDALYTAAPRGVEVLDGGLFRATLALPPRTPVGNYTAEVYLFREGRPIARRSTSMRVEKAGIERVVYEFAHGAPIIYGLFCVALAMLAGYAAAALFGRR